MSALKTALEIATSEERIFAHVVPLITDELGKYWKQPDRRDIEIDATHAMMSQSTFDKLAEYSCSQPTGVYPGKMWKRNDGLHDHLCKPEDRKWLLCWFGKSARGEDFCSNNYRIILIV